MKSIYSLLLLLLAASAAKAQVPSWLWARQGGGATHDYAAGPYFITVSGGNEFYREKIVVR